jgi:tRNA-dihydrouridine synthase
MAGVTHSAFRRLLSDFGGYGALFTEMLSARALAAENAAISPFTKKRSAEGAVIYQLLLSGDEDAGRIAQKLAPLEPAGIDINLGCPAPEIRKYRGGTGLFEDADRLRRVLDAMRRHWRGPLSVKCRLGKNAPGWQEAFIARLRLFESCGVDWLTVHPRFSDEKLKRSARWELFAWIAGRTRLPLVANGDIVAPTPAALGLLRPGPCAGLMIGRMAAVRPWIFREFSGDCPAVDYADVWSRFFDYTTEDFRPEKAIGRIKEFSAYYARNFKFGHELFRRVQGTDDLALLKKKAVEFLSSGPELTKEPSVMGI